MSLQKGGILCDVCGSYCVVEMLMDKGIEQFKIKGLDTMLHCHDNCKQVLIECGKEWQKLPSGPLRRAFEEQESKKLARALQ